MWRTVGAAAAVGLWACQTISPVKDTARHVPLDAGTSVAAVDAGRPVGSIAPCAESLSGGWVHRAAPDYRYELADDGGVVSLRRVWQRPDAGFRRVFFALDAGADAGLVGVREEPLDAGLPPPPVETELVRTANGLQGRTRGVAPSPLGQSCVVEFEVRALGCGDGGIGLETERVAVGPHCERLDGGGWLRHWLVRSPTGL